MITVKRVRKTRSQNAIEEPRGSGRGQRWWLSVRPGPPSNPSKRRAMGLGSSSSVRVATVMHAHPWEEVGACYVSNQYVHAWSLILEEYLLQDLTSETRRPPEHLALKPSCTQSYRPRISPSWPLHGTICRRQRRQSSPRSTMRGGGWAAAFLRGFLGAGRRVRNCRDYRIDRDLFPRVISGWIGCVELSSTLEPFGPSDRYSWTAQINCILSLCFYK
jgi:hypothetical protein